MKLNSFCKSPFEKSTKKDCRTPMFEFLKCYGRLMYVIVNSMLDLKTLKNSKK